MLSYSLDGGSVQWLASMVVVARITQWIRSMAQYGWILVMLGPRCVDNWTTQ